MSSIEEQLLRDIAEVTGGVVVTDSDLRDAREALDERIESGRQRGRRRNVAVAAAAAVVVVGVAALQVVRGDDASQSPTRPGPTPSESSELSDAEFLAGDAPTPALLKGVWRLDNPSSARLLISFTADGGIRFDDSGRLFTTPAVDGTYTIGGDLITVDVEGGPAGCAGQTFAMRASVPEDGAVHLLHTQPGVGNCSPAVNERWVLEQVLPTTESLSGITVPQGGASWDPPRGVHDVHGIWLAAGGGHILEMLPDGRYTVLEGYGSVVDRGQWTLSDSNTRLTFISAAEAPTCSQGDRWVLGGLWLRNLGPWTLRGALERDDCAGGFAKEAWLELAP